MQLVLAYSNGDLIQAGKLIRWIGFLSQLNGNSMLQESILLVPSLRASRLEKHKELCWFAAKVFREARCFVPEPEHEVGWPGAANYCFEQALKHVEQHFHEDMTWLEPDGIPLCPDWWDKWTAEWEVAKSLGKRFMGNEVPHSMPHMTGIAVYAADWRDYAPTLDHCPDNDAFDTHAGHQVLPNCHVTPLVQHVFRRHDPGWTVPSLGILDKRAVIFHQDKKGVLIRLLDQFLYGGECQFHPMFGYDHLYQPQLGMTKFYHTVNATRMAVSDGHRFIFNQLECFGGSIPGVLVTDVQEDQVALSSLTSNPASGITEITQEEYEEITKKKWSPLRSSTSESSNGQQPRSPQTPLIATPSKSPAVLVADPLSNPNTEGAPVVTQGNIKDINDVLKVEKVAPASAGQTVKSGRPRKSG